MNPEAIAMLYNYNHYVLTKNTDGLSHEDSLHQPHPGGNCLNWVLGHIVANRNEIMRLVGEPPVWQEEEAAPYVRGSQPLTELSRARPLSELLADFNHSQERLLKRLSQMSAADLEAAVGGKAAGEKAGGDKGGDQAVADKAGGDKTVGDQLAFLQFHEAYHAGQVGLLRRLAGKEGALR